VYDESEVPDIVDDVERRNEERRLRGKRERLPKRDEEGILICVVDVYFFICSRVEEDWLSIRTSVSVDVEKRRPFDVMMIKS